MKIAISPGNTKTGRIPALSLPPVVTCIPNAPCAKDCYALKAWKQYPATRAAWGRNLELWAKSPNEFTRQVSSYIAKRKPKFFRWHVSGDCPDQYYAEIVVEIAKAYPETKFLIFTKRYSWFTGKMPANLSVVFSCWPGLALPRSRKIPRAFMQDGTETRVKGNELDCPGNCETCGMCWNLSQTGKNVVFEKH